MIQNPNIKFSYRYTITLKDTSLNSHFFLVENQFQNSGQYVRPKQVSLWQSRKMDHNLSYRGLIWLIQKAKIKFSDISKSSMKDTSPNSHFF